MIRFEMTLMVIQGMSFWQSLPLKYSYRLFQNSISICALWVVSCPIRNYIFPFLVNNSLFFCETYLWIYSISISYLHCYTNSSWRSSPIIVIADFLSLFLYRFRTDLKTCSTKKCHWLTVKLIGNKFLSKSKNVAHKANLKPYHCMVWIAFR